jgi:hypothetical protein
MVCQELQIDESLYQNCLLEEGYQNYLREIEEETLSGILDRCADTKSILQTSSSMAALICAKAAISGSVGNQMISPATQLKAAQDILDRTGHSSKSSNNLVVVGDVESLVEIYEKRKMIEMQKNGSKMIEMKN